MITQIIAEVPPEIDTLEPRIQIDAIEAKLFSLPQRELAVKHKFTPGLYCREIFMPAGTLLTSKIHRTEHPFVIAKGRVSVWTERDGVIELSSPHNGTTYPNTRRILYIHEDCVWITYHPTTKTTVEEVEAEIIEPHVNAHTGLETKQAQQLLGIK